jgi:hypothetical protein
MLLDIFFWGVFASVILTRIFRKEAAPRTLRSMPRLQNARWWMLGEGPHKKLSGHTSVRGSAPPCLGSSWRSRPSSDRSFATS